MAFAAELGLGSEASTAYVLVLAGLFCAGLVAHFRPKTPNTPTHVLDQLFRATRPERMPAESQLRWKRSGALLGTLMAGVLLFWAVAALGG